MEKAKFFKLVMLLVFLVPHHKGYSLPRPPITPRPLCASQFALANHACGRLPFTPGYPPTPPSPPAPEPSPPSPPSPGRPSRHKHSRRRRRSHRESPLQHECCRWLQAVDNECVCELLVRLPTFLSRPIHQYTIMVDESCNATFTCASRLEP